MTPSLLAPIQLRLYEQNLTFNDIRPVQTLQKEELQILKIKF